MSDDLVIRQGAPTLAGIKTGNLFPCPYTDQASLLKDLNRLNRQLVPKGLCLLPLKIQAGKALLYLFRPGQLQKDLTHRTAQTLLSKTGYKEIRCNRCLAHLISRLRSSKEFPHEIGLFLGYPPEDVQGFIDNQAQSCKCVGCWKVYGDVEAAQKCFDAYKKCTEVYCRRWQAGDSLENLAVAL